MMYVLPHEIIEEICYFLPVRDVLALRQTCKKNYDITKSNILWWSMVNRDFCNVADDAIEDSHEKQYYRILKNGKSLKKAIISEHLDIVKYLIATDINIDSDAIDTILDHDKLSIMKLPKIFALLSTYDFSRSIITSRRVLEWLNDFNINVPYVVLDNTILSTDSHEVISILPFFMAKYQLTSETISHLVRFNRGRALKLLFDFGYQPVPHYSDVACYFGHINILKLLQQYNCLPTFIGINEAYNRRDRNVLLWLKSHNVLVNHAVINSIIEINDLEFFEMLVAPQNFGYNELKNILKYDAVAIFTWCLSKRLIFPIVTQAIGTTDDSKIIDILLHWCGIYCSFRILNFLREENMLDSANMCVIAVVAKNNDRLFNWLQRQIIPTKRDELPLICAKVKTTSSITIDLINFFDLYLM